MLTSPGSAFQLHSLHTMSCAEYCSVPHSAQNLPVLKVPQKHFQLFTLGAGAGAPQPWQNLPVFRLPQDSQNQAAAWGATG